MKLWSLTLERVRQMENELEAKTEEMRLLKVCGMFVFIIFCFAFQTPGIAAPNADIIFACLLQIFFLVVCSFAVFDGIPVQKLRNLPPLLILASSQILGFSATGFSY